MTIKTFDANRVGGGTFQLEQDPLTGEYKVKEIGFVKLPDLKLPEIEQAAPVIPDPTPDDPTDDDPTDPDPGTGGAGGGGGGNQQDFTGASMFKNIQDQATGGGDLMKQATTFAGQDTGIQVEDIGNNPERNTALKAYNEAIDNYNKVTANIRELNASGQATDVSRKAYDISRNNAQKQLDTARKEYEYRSGLDLEGTASSETIKDAPIGNFSEGPRTVPTGTLTGAEVEDIGKTFRSETDKFKTRFDPTKIEPAETKPSFKEKAKKIIDNSLPVTIAKGAAKIADAIFGEPTATQKLNTSLFKTRGDMGSNVDPGRIVGDPTKDLYAGMNRNSAYGNLEKAGNKRIETRTNTINRRGIKDKAYADANGLKYDPNGMSADFHRNTEGMKDQAAKYKREKEAAIDTSPGATGGEGGEGGEGPDSGKIVCTMMNESYGFGSFRNKIWMKFHGDIAPEYQKGYHKLFLPLVNYAKQKGITNKIIKNILEHIAVHSTIDMRQALRGKRHLLGRVYRKVILPLCYWAGRK